MAEYLVLWYLKDNRLQLHPVINNVSIPVVKSAKCLSVQSNFEEHIKYIESKVSISIGIVSKLKSFVPMQALKCMYFAFVHSHLQYDLIIWSATYKTYLFCL